MVKIEIKPLPPFQNLHKRGQGTLSPSGLPAIDLPPMADLKTNPLGLL